MAYPFYTIGHSTRPIDEFVALLNFSQVRLVVDVRSMPRSRTNPQYNFDTLPQRLSQFQIGYEHIAELGGLRGQKHDISPIVNAFWINKSFHNYADYAMSESFRFGFARLRALGHERPCAIMCAETLWWRCHRRFITDYLIAAGEAVFHILGKNHVEPANINIAAKHGAAESLTYPEMPSSEAH